MLNINKKWRQERTREMTELLLGSSELPKKAVKNIVEIMLEAEYRKERHGEWLPDTSFESKKFVRWICSRCEHWQSAANYGMPDKIFYMNYCPFCGAKMDKPEQDREQE